MRFLTFCLLTFTVLFNISLSAQTVGEYRSRQSGDWNDYNTWEQWDGSAWVTQHETGVTAVSPTIEATASGIQSSDATSHSITLPSGIVAGQLLVVVFSADEGADDNITVSVDTTESGNDWNILGQRREDDVLGAIIWKIAEGSDVLTLTTNQSEQSTHISYRISGGTIFNVSGTSNDGGNSGTASPPSHTPTQGYTPYLWIATASKDGSSVAGSAPTDFSNLLTHAGGIDGASTSTSFRNFVATDLDPANFTGFNAPNEEWVSFTVAIYSANPIYYPITYPQTLLVTGTATGVQSGADVNSHSITLPSGIVVGELLLVVFSVDANPFVIVNTDVSGNNWTKLSQASQASTVTGAIFWKIAEGSDVLTLTTSNTQRSSHITYRISGAVDVSGSFANGSSINSDPPNHSPFGGAWDYLWIATRSGDDEVVATAAPASFSNLLTQAAGHGGGASTNTAIQLLNTASLNPGTFTSTSEQWVSYTLAIRSAGTATVLSGHTVTTTEDVSVPNLTINSTGTVVLNDTLTTPTGGTLTNNVGGVIKGTGVLDFSGNTFTNTGTIAPGLSPGKLYVNNSFVNNGVLNIEISGASSGGAGVTFDQLDVDGHGAINGTINIDFGVYIPVPGDTYQIVSSKTDEYSGSPELTVVNNVVPVTYANGVLTIYPASYEKIWDGGANTDVWEDGNNWHPNGVPTAGQDVLIALDANVILSSNPSIKSLVIGLFETADTLNIAENYSLTTTGNGPIGNDGLHLSENFENVLIVNGSLIISGCTGDGVDISPMTSLIVGSTGSISITSPGNDGIEIGDDFSNSGSITISNPIQHGLNVQTGAAGSTIENTSTGEIIVSGIAVAGYGVNLGTGTSLTNDGTITLTTNFVNIFSGSGDLMNNGTFKGIGNIDGNDFFSGSGSTIAPGTSPGKLTFTNSSGMDFSNNVIFDFEINGNTTPGVDYDQIVITGPSVNITNATLNLSGTYAPVAGDVFTLFQVSGGSIVGAFNGLPEGAELILNGKTLTISYVGGNISLNFLAPLPVELIDFNAQAMENEIKLTWATATEINNDYFTIERSLDGRTFETIATIFGNGTTTEISNYSHMDKNPIRGLNYYRLKQTDFDGQFSYSDIKTAELKNNEIIKIYPTVVNEVVTVETGNDFDGEVTIVVRDLTGRDYKSIPMTSKSNKVELSLNDLIPGIYFVIITANTTAFTQKIIKL